LRFLRFCNKASCILPNGKDTRNGLNLKGGLSVEEKIGYVSNYFSKISVAAVEITDGTVSVGETLHFKGHSTDLKSKVVSMQIEHESVAEAKQGDCIGLKVSEKVRKKAKVYKIIEN
jgi:putative protease